LYFTKQEVRYYYNLNKILNNIDIKDKEKYIENNSDYRELCISNLSFAFSLILIGFCISIIILIIEYYFTKKNHVYIILSNKIRGEGSILMHVLRGI